MNKLATFLLIVLVLLQVTNLDLICRQWDYETQTWKNRYCWSTEFKTRKPARITFPTEAATSEPYVTEIPTITETPEPYPTPIIFVYPSATAYPGP